MTQILLRSVMGSIPEIGLMILDVSIKNLAILEVELHLLTSFVASKRQ